MQDLHAVKTLYNRVHEANPCITLLFKIYTTEKKCLVKNNVIENILLMDRVLLNTFGHTVHLGSLTILLK